MTHSHAFTVLLVTQEDQPRGATTDILQGLGFDVILAKDGRHAVEAVRREPAIDLLIAPMDLSDLDGITLAQLAQLHRPDLKVLLLCADLSELRTAARFELYGLEAPVAPHVLAAVASDTAVSGLRGNLTKLAVATADTSPPRWIAAGAAAA